MSPHWSRAGRFAVIAIAVVGVVVVGVQVLVSGGLGRAPSAPAGLVAAFALLSIAIQLPVQWLRSVKHRILLEEIRPVRTLRVFEGQMIGFVFSTVLPFRLGELVRAHYIGRAISISRAAVFATIVFERLVDSIVLAAAALLLLVVVGGWVPAIVSALVWLVVLALVLGGVLIAARTQQRLLLAVVLHVTGLFNDRIRDRLRMVAWSIVYALRTVVLRRNIVRYVLLSVGMWFGYFVSVLVFVAGVVPALGLLDEIRATIATFLSVSVPSGPAYLGTYGQLFAGISGLAPAVLAATGLALATWALVTLPSTAIGLGLLLTKQFAPRGSAADKTSALENKLYRDADITPEFSHFLDAYFRNDRITKLLSNHEAWGSFRVLRTFKGGSNALTMLASQNGATVVKKVTLPQYGDKLADQYEWLARRAQHSEIAHVVGPYEDTPEYASLNIEFRPEYVTFFDFIHSNSVEASAQVLRRVWTFMAEEVHAPAVVPPDREARLRGYIDSKVLQKAVDASKSSVELSRLLSYETLVVNGREVRNLQQVLDVVQGDERMLADLSTFTEGAIHGDLTVDNLMVDPRTFEFLVLDPNNENAISDPVVDGGKLLQSLHSGYEFLVSLTQARVTENAVLFEENRSEQYARLDRALREVLAERLDERRFRALLFHEAVHYFRMLTYRVHIDPVTAPAFYALAIRLLNDYVDQYDR